MKSCFSLFAHRKKELSLFLIGFSPCSDETAAADKWSS